MTEEIPQWAKERACELANAQYDYPVWSVRDVGGHAAITVLARYIAQHEQPPVDPDLVKAREICARVETNPVRQKFYSDGDRDASSEVQFALSALKEARNG